MKGSFRSLLTMNRLSIKRKDIQVNKDTECFIRNSEISSSISEELILPLVKMLHIIYIADMVLETG